MDEDNKKLDPKEVEAKMIEAAEVRANDVEGMALNAYRQLHPRFMQGLHRISSKGRLRLLKAMVEYPINPGSYKLNDNETEMLEIGSMLLESKFVLIMNTYAEHAEELVEAAEGGPLDVNNKE